MDTTTTYAVLSGVAVGASLGITGGGGSIFAVPLLLYVLKVPVGTAMGLSLATVGLTAGFGAALGMIRNGIEWRAGIIFSIAGMICAPLGALIAHQIAPVALLSTFAIFMMLTGWRMWRSSGNQRTDKPSRCIAHSSEKFGPECYVRLGIGGIFAGLLSGLFGVGGGFIIIPVLLFVTSISIQRAVTTSLLIIFLIALSGVSTHIVQGNLFPQPVSILFISGSFAGMILGGRVRSRINAYAMTKVIAICIWLVALLMLGKSVLPMLQ